jgi:hypothetical protein
VAGGNEVVAAETKVALGVKPTPVPQRNDALQFDYNGPWEWLNSLRTAVAAFAVLTLAVPRPKSLLCGEHLPAIVHAVNRVRRLNTGHPPRSFRFDAAGSGSAVFQKLAGQLAAARTCDMMPLREISCCAFGGR